GAAGGTRGGGGAAVAFPPGVMGEDGEPFVIQKFIKSKGPHAFIRRQVLEHGRSPTAWMISNNRPYGGDIKEGEAGGGGESLVLAGSGLLGRLVTTPAEDWGCGIVPLHGAACGETADAAGRLKHHLEAVIGRLLDVLVCDFTKDGNGRWWMLQVKAMRFRNCTPSKPFSGSGCHRKHSGFSQHPPGGEDHPRANIGHDRKNRDENCLGYGEGE
ncbi:unnamed protein product, partial [Choristocarpus tenellus]